MSSKHCKLLLRAGVILLCTAGFGSAALDFNTYRIVKKTVKVRRDTVLVDSTVITYELTRLGSTSLEASSLTLTSHGSYLSVVEEATLTGNVENRPHDITQDFLLQGSLPIPPLAAVHSLSAMHGDTLFPARLRKTIYSLNDVFFDTVALKSTLDGRVAFLQQLTDQGFEATFSKLSLGEPVRVRIQYYLPMPGAPGAPVRVPVLFHPSGRAPRQAQITFFERAMDLPALQWQSPDGRVSLDTSGTHTVPYQSEFLFLRSESPATAVTLQATVFESGSFKGNYLLFKGGLNDSLMDRLSRPLEVVFLWRWNPPYAFVEIQNGLKTLSGLGLLVSGEARTLKEIIREFSPRGHRFGLFRSAPGFADTLLPPAGEGEDGHAGLLAYLDQFDEQRLFADFKDYKEERPGWVPTPWTDSGEIEKSARSFLAALERVRKSFSNRPEALRHIEMVGFGSAYPTLIDLKDPKAIESVLDTVTLANVNAPWLGIDMDRALDLKANADLRPLSVNSPLAANLGPLLFPVFQPTSVEYRAFTPSRTHAVVLPFGINAQRQAMIKAANPFQDTLQLQGIDALGRRTRILTLRPRFLRAQADSAMARIWAADPDRIAEASEVDLGMRYGILTKGTYWGAGTEDAIVLPNGGPIRVRLVQLRGPQAFRLERGFLRVDLPGQQWGPSPRLDIYDLRGRLLLSLSLAAYRSAGGFAIPVEVLNRLGKARVVLVLRGAGTPQTFALNLGGHP